MFENGILIGLGIFVAWFVVIPLIGIALSCIPLVFLGLVALFGGTASSVASAKLSRRELKRRQALGYDTDLPLPPPWWKGIFAPARDEVAHRRKLGYGAADQRDD
jgi:hypothetical protein